MRTAAALALALLVSCGLAPERPLGPGVHFLREPIVIRGNGRVADFDGVTLVGSPEATAPDRFEGTAILVEGGRDVTIRNVRIRGFKVGILARDVEQLTLEDCDLSGNWRQRLHSTPEAEAAEDWLYGHQNDDNEWLRYGAAIYLERCPGAVIRRNRGHNGQNGICLTRSDGCRIYDNDFSFNSSWGLAMYRSSRNLVTRNRFDWCIRGYSHGVYSRGQDSAGILVYEQSSDNVFAFNSATHGGDGFFLWAGHETLDRTGEGGCNRNLLYRNDFSHAAANGIEATFSVGNRFVGNRIEECEHGVWAGYSSETEIVGNFIARCANGISIEHGTGNRIEGNALLDNGTAIHLWWDRDEDLFRTAYGRKRDTGSHDYRIAHNVIRGGKVAVRLRDTHRVRIERNHVDSRVTLLDAPGCNEVSSDANEVVENARGPELGPDWWERPLTAGIFTWSRPLEPQNLPRALQIEGSLDPFLPPGALRGREHIFVDEWGPRDPADPAIAADRAGQAVNLATGWTVRFQRWDSAGPRQPPADWEAVLASEPVETLKADRLDFHWPGKPTEKVPADFFATIATAEMELEAGEYELLTVSDDGLLVRIDGKVVLEDWTWHPPKAGSAKVTLAKGRHAIVVEHFEIDGYARLRVALRPARDGQ